MPPPEQREPAGFRNNREAAGNRSRPSALDGHRHSGYLAGHPADGDLNVMASQSPAARIAAARWYHRFEILPGLFTPGIVTLDAAAMLDSMGIPKNLAGK